LGDQAEIDYGARPGTCTTEVQRLAELEREVKDLRRANAVLRSASSTIGGRGAPRLGVVDQSAVSGAGAAAAANGRLRQ